MNNLGWTELVRGAYAEAEALLTECFELAAALGDVRHEVLATGNLGLVALLTGDAETAERRFRDNLDRCRTLRDRRAAEEALRGTAAIAAARGDPGRAGLLWGAADALYTRALTPPEAALHARFVAPVAASPAFVAGRAAAARLALDEALDAAFA